MPAVFTVEDGTGLTNSNAYASLAFVDQYHLDRGNTKWTGANAVKQAGIVRATDYVDKRFRVRFRGTRSSAEQALQWPRVNAQNDNGFFITDIPTAIKQAIAEYALRAILNGVLAPDPSQNTPSQSMVTGVSNGTETTSGVVTSSEDTVGPLKEKRTYANSSSIRVGQPTGIVSGLVLPEYPEADMILEAILRSSNENNVVRG